MLVQAHKKEELIVKEKQKQGKRFDCSRYRFSWSNWIPWNVQEPDATGMLATSVVFKMSYCITLKGEDIWEHLDLHT